MSKQKNLITDTWVPINRPMYAKFTTAEGRFLRETVLAWRIVYDYHGKACEKPDIVGIDYLGHTGHIISCPLDVEWDYQ